MSDKVEDPPSLRFGAAGKVKDKDWETKTPRLDSGMVAGARRSRRFNVETVSGAEAA